MKWEIANHRDFLFITEFLKKREHSCVLLTSRLRKQNSRTRPGVRETILLGRTAKGAVEGVVYVSSFGLVLPVFHKEQEVSREEGVKIASIISDTTPNLHSIIGIEKDVAKMESLLETTSEQKIHYLLMSRNSILPVASRTPSIAGVNIRRAEKKDIRSLFPLQRGYELEEVVIHPTQFNERVCHAELKRTLAEQITYLAQKGKTFIAKGGTNGRGYNYYQLGGVFTHPDYRNTGVSKALLSHLIKRIASEGKNVCLFVKKKNTAALKVYESLDFVRREDFTIAYL